MKRIFDIIVSCLALIVCIIPMLIIAIIIKCTSEGPIFFIQKRIGKDERFFMIYKFRTMHIDTPNVSTENLGDPSYYITKVGGFLRRTSLDELPQLFNILLGDMSVVGPRPALYNQYELTEKRKKLGIHKFRPGLTGYAQIMGRDFLSDEEKVTCDYYYISHQNLLLDMKIIILTLLKVIRGDGIGVR